MTVEEIAVIELEEYPIEGDHLGELREATIKAYGRIWRIHKNDADPFPSNPHAHCLETGHKLDLGTGGIFIGTRPAGGNFKRKHLLTLRRAATEKGVKLPPLVV